MLLREELAHAPVAGLVVNAVDLQRVLSAVVGDRDILLDAESRTGDYTLPITPGPRSSFGDIVIAGPRPVFDPGHIATIARFHKGELYDSRKVDDLRKALVATGLFSVVSISPR